MERYFIKFPTLTYSNTQCRDITRRVVMLDDLKQNPSLYHKYTIKAGLRADLIADSYYEDSMLDWMIFLNNGIVDPYYGWYLDDIEFEEYIKKKYGSVENAMKKIIYFRLNWPDDDTELSPSYYENTLPDVLKKYYSPNFNLNNKIVSYTRKKEDIITNTNKLLQFDISIDSGNSYVVGEIVDIYNNALSEVVGVCEVVYSNTSYVKVHHIGGNTSPTNKLVGENSNTHSTITTTTVLYENLPDDEAVFWGPVYYYEYEVEKNEANKNIRLLDKSYAMEVSEKLRVAIKA